MDLSKQESPVKREFKYIFFCTLGAVVIAFNLKSFVSTGGLFPGGFAGATLLVTRSLEQYMNLTVPYSAIYIPMNLVPIYIGIRYLGRRFTFYSVYVIVLSSILTDVFPQVTITYDILLIAIFGGLINGAAISLCLYVGASGGGTDFISIFMAEKYGKSAWHYILIGNVVILGVAGFLFGWDKALYSLIYQFVTTQVLQTFHKRYNKETLMIITDKPEQVYEIIRSMTHHAGTLFKGEGLYDGETRNMIISVISGDQVSMVVNKISEEDPKAFVNVWKTEQITGRFYSRPNE